MSREIIMYTYIKRSVLFLSVIFMLSVHQALAKSGLPDFTEMVKEYSPAVVNISTRQTQAGKTIIGGHELMMPELGEGHPLNDMLRKFFGEQFEIPDFTDRDSRSLGSGFIISDDGYILTNHHVVETGDEVLVRLTDRREFKAKVIGSDKDSDIAVIKIDAEDLPTVKLGKAADLEVGEWVLAIGTPFGFDHSVTAGIVSAKGRNLPSDNYVPFIQTDVAINPGNSGGPLFNLNGEVVGVNSQIYSRSGGFMGLSFSIPIELAMNVAEQIKSHGQVARGYLGVLIQDVTHELAESFGMKIPSGALVSRVMPDSPAAEAGLQAGDVILKFNKQPVERSAQLPPLVGASAIDKPAQLLILRNGREQTVQVNLSRLPGKQTQLAAHSPSEKNAISEDRVGLQIRLSEDPKGVLVEKVSPGAGSLAGIEKGDVIIMVNNQQINSVKDYQTIIDNAEPGRSLAFLVQRDGGAVFIPVRMPLK